MRELIYTLFTNGNIIGGVALSMLYFIIPVSIMCGISAVAVTIIDKINWVINYKNR